MKKLRLLEGVALLAASITAFGPATAFGAACSGRFQTDNAPGIFTGTNLADTGLMSTLWWPNDPTPGAGNFCSDPNKGTPPDPGGDGVDAADCLLATNSTFADDGANLRAVGANFTTNYCAAAVCQTSTANCSASTSTHLGLLLERRTANQGSFAYVGANATANTISVDTFQTAMSTAGLPTTSAMSAIPKTTIMSAAGNTVTLNVNVRFVAPPAAAYQAFATSNGASNCSTNTGATLPRCLAGSMGLAYGLYFRFGSDGNGVKSSYTRVDLAALAVPGNKTSNGFAMDSGVTYTVPITMSGNNTVYLAQSVVLFPMGTFTNGGAQPPNSRETNYVSGAIPVMITGAAPSIDGVGTYQNLRDVKISWKTSSEPSTSGFNVYRSTDNINFTKVNTELIPATGQGGAGASYDYTDQVPRQRTYTKYYYRIDQIANNGDVLTNFTLSVTH